MLENRESQLIIHHALGQSACGKNTTPFSNFNSLGIHVFDAGWHILPAVLFLEIW